MESGNFISLKSHWPELFEFGTAAERFAYEDPATAVVKLRCFAEGLVRFVYQKFAIPTNRGDGLFELVDSPYFGEAVGRSVALKLNAIRVKGNGAAHGKSVSNKDALWLIKEAYLLGEWLCKTFDVDFGGAYPGYVAPPRPTATQQELVKSNEDLERQLAEAKDQLEAIKNSDRRSQAELEKLRQEFNAEQLESLRVSSRIASVSIDFLDHITEEQIKIQDAFSEYQLNDDQTALVDHLEQFLKGQTESVFLLKGYAGTGKTFITKGLTEFFRATGRNYVLAAPTGKASKVIAEKTKSPAYTIHKTIFSFKDIEEFRVQEIDGTETYKFYSKLAVNDMSVDTVYIVDEASMVCDVYQEQEFFRFGSGYLLRDFLKYVNLDHNDHRKKVIFIGDDAQLPPVGMNFSPALSAEYLLETYGARSTEFQLREVVRQRAESGVIANSMCLRKSIKEGIFNQLQFETSEEDISTVEHRDLMREYLDSCDGKIGRQSIVIAHSNADVAAYNRRIREHFFPDETEIVAGDKVMATANSYSYGIFISNGDFGLIREVLGPSEKRNITLRSRNSETGAVQEISVPIAFRNVEVVFRDINGEPRSFEAKVFEPLLYSDKPTLSSDENKALYVDFCMRHKDLRRGSLEFKETLRNDPYFNALRLKYGYAITCHKAQGSEWDHVFVKCKTHQNQLTADYFRWLYTAITRTSNKLYLLDPPNIKVGDGIKEVSPPTVWPTGEDHQSEYKGGIQDQAETAARKEPDETPGEQKTFGIPEGMPFLRTMLSTVRERTSGLGIDIEDVIHNQYQEAYIFKKGNDFVRVNIGYNAKEKITTVQSQTVSELATELIEQLKDLEGQRLLCASGPGTRIFEPEEPFLYDFHQRLIGIIKDHDFGMRDVEERDWVLRYTFTRDKEVAVFDFFYNGRKQFKKYMPVTSASTSSHLVSDVQTLLSKSFRS